MQQSSIIKSAIDFLIAELGEQWHEMLISEVRVGPFLTAVKLSDGSAGVSSTLSNTAEHCNKKDRRFGEFSPLYFRGRKLTDLFVSAPDNHIVDSLRMASLHALSAAFFHRGRHKLHRDTDPIDLIDLEQTKSIVVVGAFQSYIRRILPTKNKLSVLELRKDALTPDQQHLFVPAHDARSVLADADVVILTGMTLLNGTLGELLDMITGEQLVIITGPSGSIVPDVLFQNKIDLIGATLVTKPEVLMDLVGEAGSAYHLFHYCARKITMSRVVP
ncbi:MAG: DUF364 domain-containing protein [Bacteroidales bacterium]|nr:DUF364 domain-containing protein [Bacteroidales bacterium]